MFTMDDDLAKLSSCPVGREVLDMLEEHGFSCLMQYSESNAVTFYYDLNGASVTVRMDDSVDESGNIESEVWVAISFDCLELNELEVGIYDISVERVYEVYNLSYDDNRNMVIDYFEGLAGGFEDDCILIENFNRHLDQSDIFHEKKKEEWDRFSGFGEESFPYEKITHA